MFTKETVWYQFPEAIIGVSVGFCLMKMYKTGYFL